MQERARLITGEALNTAAMEVEIENVNAQDPHVTSIRLTPPGFDSLSMRTYASPVVYSTVCNLREEARDACIYKRSYALEDQQTSRSRKDYLAMGNSTMWEYHVAPGRKFYEHNTRQRGITKLGTCYSGWPSSIKRTTAQALELLGDLLSCPRLLTNLSV